MQNWHSGDGRGRGARDAPQRPKYNELLQRKNDSRKKPNIKFDYSDKTELDKNEDAINLKGQEYLKKDLVDKEGYDPKSTDYYEEINKRITVDFPHKFAKGGSVETSGPVGRRVKTEHIYI